MRHVSNAAYARGAYSREKEEEEEEETSNRCPKRAPPNQQKAHDPATLSSTGLVFAISAVPVRTEARTQMPDALVYPISIGKPTRRPKGRSPKTGFGKAKSHSAWVGRMRGDRMGCTRRRRSSAGPGPHGDLHDGSTNGEIAVYVGIKGFRGRVTRGKRGIGAGTPNDGRLPDVEVPREATALLRPTGARGWRGGRWEDGGAV